MLGDELKEALEELFAYFELDKEDWPVTSVYSMGSFYTGIISDDLYQLLTNLKDAYIEEGGESFD